MRINLKQLAVLSFGLLATGASQAEEAWDLTRCIEYAIAHNLTVKQQEAARDKSAVELNTAKWSRLPDLNSSASHSFNFGRSLQSNNTYQSINTQNTGFNLSTSVPLFTGMQIPNNIALSKLNLQAATEDLNKAKEDISIQVTSAYLQVLFNEELVKIARQQVELSQEILTQKEAYFQNGKASEAELYEAKSRVAQDQLSLVQTENDYRLSLLDLSQLLELPSPDNFQIVSPDIQPEQLFGTLTSPTDIYNQAQAFHQGGTVSLARRSPQHPHCPKRLLSPTQFRCRSGYQLLQNVGQRQCQFPFPAEGQFQPIRGTFAEHPHLQPTEYP